MRGLFPYLAAVLLGVAPPSPAALEEATPPAAAEPKTSSEAVKKELQKAIEGQLAAFRADDYAKAYTFAASEIQGMFGVEEFEAMVKRGYPAIAHSGVVEFGLAFDTGEDAVVNVRIEDQQKRSALYQYQLKKQGGQWKVGGVTELRAGGGISV